MADKEKELNMFLLAEGCQAAYTTYLLYRDTLYINTTARYEQNVAFCSPLTPNAREMLCRAVENLDIPAWESVERIQVLPETGRQVRLIEYLYDDGERVKWLSDEAHSEYRRAEPILLLLRQFPTRPVNQVVEHPRYQLADAFGRRHPIDRAPYYIGRRSELFAKFLSMTLAGNSISRVHAALIPKEGKLYLRDEGSKNGTFYNGMYLDPGFLYEVEPGGEIRIGNTCFLIEQIPDQDNRKDAD
ncbi:MAG: FHA domain-containing protein [Ruminococcus sp.]|nr:FHA domain-containing protein [Ruminococcus sp.]